MAVEVLYNAYLMVNSVDLSVKAKQLEVNFGQETKEVTAFGDVARKSISGLATPSIKGTVYAERGTGNTEATLWALMGVGVAPFNVVVKHKNTTTATTNPQYTMTSILDGFSPVNGSTGDVEEYSVNFVCASGLGIVRTTS